MQAYGKNTYGTSIFVNDIVVSGDTNEQLAEALKTYDLIDVNSLESLADLRRSYLPNYTRTRHTYRGPRKSEKVNLDIYQTNYEILKLKKDLAQLVELTVAIDEVVSSGEFFADVQFYNSEDEATYSYDVVGIDSLIKAIAPLLARIKKLERQNG